MFDSRLSVDTEELIDFVLEFESESDLLVECLICLLEVFVEDIFLVCEVDVLLFQKSYLFKDLNIFFFV